MLTATANPGRSHWFDTASSHCAAPPLRGDMRTDVAIVGGGINGLSTALHLGSLDPSVDVTLVEAAAIGFGASGRNAGQYVVSFGGGDWARLARRHGTERMRAGWDHVARGAALLVRLAQEEGIDCDLMPAGCAQIALRHEPPARLEAYRRFLDDIGQGEFVTYLSERAIANQIESPYLGSGLLDSRCGQFHPLKLLRGIKHLAEARGTRFFENSPVTHIDRTGRDIVVTTGEGSLRCSKLVLATNAYSAGLAGLEPLKVRNMQKPVMVHASATAPLSEAQWRELGWQRRFGVNIFSDLFYSFAPTADGRLVYVSGHHGRFAPKRLDEGEISAGFTADGPRHLGQFFPALRGIETVRTWGGVISASVDGLPHVGLSDDPRISFAYGCWGNGMPLGLGNGAVLAELALERRTASSEAWFVTRAKPHWPARMVTGLGAAATVALRRARNRRIGRRMSPPLVFESGRSQ